jgi:hypothetical protein
MTQPAFIDVLAVAADSSSAAETEYRREAAERIKVLAQERAFAFRRLNLMRDMARAVTGAEDEDAAVACALAALRSRLGWVGDSEVHSAILSRFRPVAEALFASLRPDGEPPTSDIGAALAEFESWYADNHAAPFWTLFERYMAETPLVDF